MNCSKCNAVIDTTSFSVGDVVKCPCGAMVEIPGKPGEKTKKEDRFGILDAIFCAIPIIGVILTLLALVKGRWKLAGLRFIVTIVGTVIFIGVGALVK